MAVDFWYASAIEALTALKDYELQENVRYVVLSCVKEFGQSEKESAGESKESDSTKSATDSEEIHKGTLVDTPCDSLTAQGDQAKDDQPGNVTDNARSEDKHETLESSKGTESHSGSCEQSRSQSDQSSAVNVKNGESKASSTLVHALQQSNGNEECSNEENDKQKCVLDVNSGLESKNRKMSLTENIVNNTTEVAISTDKDTPKDGEENTNNVNIPIPNLNISEETSSKEMESNDSVVCSNPLRNNPDTSVNENSEMIPDSPCPKPNQESVSANDIHSKVELQPKERAGENAILSDSETMSLTQIQENQTSLDSLNTVESKTTTASVQNTQFVDSKECSKVDNNELSSSIKNNLFSGTEVGCLDSTEESTKSNLNDESMSALEDGETSDNGTCATDNVSMDEDCEQDISEPEGTDQIDNASVGISHASSEVKGIDGESVSNAVSNFEANGIRPQALSCSESNSSIDSNLPGFREKTSIESESKVTEDSNQAGQIISLFSQITAGSDASNEDLIGLIRVKLNEEMAKMKAREISNDGQDPVESTNTYILNDNRPSIINTSMPDDVAAMSNNFEINKAHATTSAEMSSSQTNDHKSNIETGSATKSDTKCTDGVEQGENSNIKTNPKDIGGSAVGIEKDKESKDNTSNKQPTIPETDKTCKVVKQMTGDRSERGNTKGKAQPIVIDLDAEADIESNKTLIGRGEKTPVKQGRHNVRMTPNKTSGRSPRLLQSPGQMSGRVLQNVHKTPNKTSSTPSKKNFIENLIATGVPIIIPDDDEKTPKEQSNDLQTKIAAQQRHFREAMKGKENPTFGDLAETSGMSGSVPVYQFTPPRARPMQRFDISSPESLSYRPRPIAPKPSSPAAAVAQEAFTYQPLAPRRQLLPYPEQSQSNIQQSPKGPSQVRSDMRYAAQNTTLPQTSSSPVLQQFAEQSGQQYSGLPSQGYAVGTPSSPAYKVGQVTQEYQSGQSTQSYRGAGPSPLRQQLAQKSQLQHVMQNQQGKLSRQSLVDEANAQFGRQNRPIQPAGDATTPVKYFGQSPQMERYRPQRQYMVQGQTRRSVDNSPQQLRHRRIAPLLPSPNKQPEKRDISGTLVIIDDDTPVASSAPRMEQTAKEQMSRKVQNTQNRSPSIERQEPRGLTLPLVIRDVQSIAPVTTNPKDPGENPVSSIRNDPSTKKVAVPQPPANVTIKQEPKDGFTDQVQTTSIGKQNTVPNKRERPVENPEERAKQRSNEPPLKKIKREPGLGDVADTIATTSQKEQETTKPSKMAMADTQENDSPNTSKTSEIIPKADEPMRKQRRTRSDVVRSESCPSPGPSKEKSQDGTSVTSSKEKPEVVLDIDVDDADGYIRNIALEAGEKSDVAKASKPSTAQAKDDSEKVKVKIENDESSQSEGDQSGKSRKGADMSQKQFGCGDCGKTFNKKKSLSQHFKIHTRETPFECDVCGKHFSMKTSLKKHIYTHFDEKK